MPKDLVNDALKKVTTGMEIAAEFLEDRERIRSRRERDELVNKIMEELKRKAAHSEAGSKDADDLHRHYQKNGEGSCYAWSCNSSATADLDRKLTEAGIPHACLQAPGKNALFVAKDVDRQKVDIIRDDLIREMQNISKVSLDELRRENIDQNLHVIRNTSQTYAAVFQEEAKKLGFSMAITDNKNGTFDIHYSERDAGKAKSALIKSVESTRGVVGKLNEFRVTENERLQEELYNGIADPQKDFYVASAEDPNEHIHFTPEGYQYFLDGKLRDDGLRNNPNFQQDAHNRVDKAFSRPVILSRDEFERIREFPKDKYKEEIEKKHVKTRSISSRDMRHLELERMAHLMAELKMQGENNSLNTDYYNTAQSINQFVNYEHVTDDRIERIEVRDLAENATNREALPPQSQLLVEEYEKLPYEERIYVDEITKECLDDIRRIETEVEVEEVTREDIEERDIDALIAELAGERSTTTETVEEHYETEREF